MLTDPETLKHLATLPVLSGFTAAECESLISQGTFRTYKKGKVLFRQGEDLPNFYLILDGWVKIFKGSDTGTEAVLQVRTNGEALMPPSVFLNIPALASAQLVQDTSFLIIPAAIIRKNVTTDGKLALNAIHCLSTHSQDLIQNIEHSRLMSAAERVGWFLLKLNLKQSRGTEDIITLPYDKSTVASYLDMTPETFSRTLKQFKNKGFEVSNHTVTKPNANALCQFCDGTLSKSCSAPDCTVKREHGQLSC